MWRLDYSLVGLRGLEPLDEIVRSCVDADFTHAKGREPTSADLGIYREVLTASTRHMGLRVETEDLQGS